MYDTHDYLWGLWTYALGGVLVMMFLYLYCRKIPWKHLRNLILLFATVFIFTPVASYPDNSFLAPAWFVALFEGFTIDEPNSYLRGLTPLIITLFFGLLLYAAYCVFLWQRHKKQLNNERDSATDSFNTDQLENP